MRIGFFFVAGLLLTFAAVAIPSCTPPAPSGQGGMDMDSGDGSGDGQMSGSSVSGLFDDDEVWILDSTGLGLGGFGGRLEFAVINAGGDTGVCTGVDPSADVALVGQSLQVTTTFTDIAQSRMCAVEFSADASACEPGSVSGPRECGLSDVTGTVSVGDVQLPVGTTGDIKRLVRCDADSLTVATLGSWGAFNTHPFTVQFIPSAEAIGAIVTFGGSGETLLGTSVVTDEVNVIGCVDENVVGGVTLESGRLRVGMDLQGLDNAARTGTAGDCRIEFDGRVVYCVLTEGTLAAQGAQIVRFEGTGRWTENERSGDLNVLYMLLAADTSSGGRR